MPRKPTNAEIAEQEAFLVDRQREIRVAADRVAAALFQHPEVTAISLIGSAARPLRREVPRFSPYRQLRMRVAHECKDVDLADWISRLDGLAALRKTRIRAQQELVAEYGSAPAVQEIEVFLLEPGTNGYLGRLCNFRDCPAGKIDCVSPGCGRFPYLKQHTGFTFWANAIADDRAVKLYDRAAGGLIGKGVDLPSMVLDG